VYSYSVWEAVKNLYDSTDAARSRDFSLPTGPRKAAYKPVTMMKKDSIGRRILRAGDLDNPIRTLVIGIVANENDPDVRNNAKVLEEVRRMRLNLVRMAVAGQGGDASKIDYNNMYNAPYQPFFADNVASLQIAVQNALTSLSAAQAFQQEKGAMVELKGDSKGADHGLLSAMYRVTYNNQWEGTLRKYRTVRSGDSIVGMTQSGAWELGENLKQRRDTVGLNIMHWDGVSGKFRTLSPSEAEANDIFGLKDRLVVFQNANRLPHNEAFYQWLRGYDYSYVKGTLYPRASILADFGQSSIALVDKPASSADTLPGYKAWSSIESVKNNPATIYAQTNDGILHVIDSATGDVKKTILMPPVLLPTRLATTKTNPAVGDKLSWVDVTAPDGADGSTRSIPAYILDGPLQVRRFSGIRFDKGWGTYLLGSLGKGGNGLYMLDVSDYDDPKVMWYHEKYKNFLVSMPPGAAAPSWSAPVSGDYAGYAKLGYNSPKPAMGVVMTPGSDLSGNPNMQNIIVLAGGVQTDLDPLNNGGEGATLLVLDPKDGRVLKAFGGDSLENSSKFGSGVMGAFPHMGMIVSEPTLFRTSDKESRYAPYVTGRAYVADNRGNIFAAFFEELMADSRVNRLSPDKWKIKMVATLQNSLASVASSVSNYAVPYGVTLDMDDKSIWVAGGTSDVTARKTGVNDPGVISNDLQMIFAFKTGDGQKTPLARNDIQSLDKLPGTAMTSGGNGWYIPLDKTKSNFDEYMSAKPLLVNGTLFVSTFTTTKFNLQGADDLCAASTRIVDGYSRIYALDTRNGSANLWKSKDGKKKKYIQVDGIRISGLTHVKGMRNGDGSSAVLASFDGLEKDALPKLDQENARYVNGFSAIEIKILPGKTKADLSPGQSVIIYWLEK
jgi:Tfp pilus tip-associated adhesin PilY1